MNELTPSNIHIDFASGPGLYLPEWAEGENPPEWFSARNPEDRIIVYDDLCNTKQLLRKKTISPSQTYSELYRDRALKALQRMEYIKNNTTNWGKEGATPPDNILYFPADSTSICFPTLLGNSWRQNTMVYRQLIFQTVPKGTLTLRSPGKKDDKHQEHEMRVRGFLTPQQNQNLKVIDFRELTEEERHLHLYEPHPDYNTAHEIVFQKKAA